MAEGDLLMGSRALVTGASRGIGQATAIELAALGADVALLQRGEATETVATIEALGRRAPVVRVDIADSEAAAHAVDEAADTLGGLDIAILNAGTTTRTPALDVTLEEWRHVLDVNLTGVFVTAQAAARRFVAQGGGGCIVAIASVLAYQGGWRVPAYAASKGGVAQLTKALANEWAPLRIRVNAVAPGYVDDDLTAALRADPERNRQITERIPAGRWAAPEEIAKAVAFLVSPGASYVHGCVLNVDGGWLGR